MNELKTVCVIMIQPTNGLAKAHSVHSDIAKANEIVEDLQYLYREANPKVYIFLDRLFPHEVFIK